MDPGIMFLVLIIVEFILDIFNAICWKLTGKKIIYNIREKIFNLFQHLPLSFFDKMAAGRVVTGLFKRSRNH